VSGFENQLIDLVRRVVREELEKKAELISVAGAAARIAMSEKYIRAAIADGRLPAKRFGDALRVSPADVDALGSEYSPRRRTRRADTPAQRALAALRAIGGKR
jgi:excisionase family DNA binding protein